MVELKGMTWDHVRGYAPLVSAAEEFQRLHQDVRISWDKRSLKDFEDYPIEILAKKYDMILLDHPFIGSGVEKGVIVPLDELISADYLADQKKNSVGKSYDSYTWGGNQWALAIDTAAQVSAYRADLLNHLGLQVPKTWNEVFQLIADLPDGFKVGIPLNPTHAYCSFLSLCANMGGTDFWNTFAGIDLELGTESLGILQRLIPLVHPRSLEMNPIQLSDLMSETDGIAYVPLMYGYSNYARDGYAPHVVHFTNIPSMHGEPSGSILGGVGFAISAYSKQKQTAADFAVYVGSGECQNGLYFESGGQPGYRTAWTNPNVNQQSTGFFENTLCTLDLAYVRPRKPGSILFQEQAGEIIHHFLKHGGSSKDTIQNFNRLYDKIVQRR